MKKIYKLFLIGALLIGGTTLCIAQRDSQEEPELTKEDLKVQKAQKKLEEAQKNAEEARKKAEEAQKAKEAKKAKKQDNPSASGLPLAPYPVQTLPANPPVPSVDMVSMMKEEILRNAELKKEKSALEKENQNLKKLYQQVTDSIEKAKEEGEALNDILARRCIVTGSYFLNIPYTAEGVKRGIASYEGAKGTPYYDRQMVRLNLLKSYKEDATAFKDFLKTFQGVNFKVKQGVYSAPACEKYLSALRALPAYQKYKQYDYMNETYLGSMMLNLESLLSAAVSRNEASANQIVPTAGKYGKELSQLLK